MTDTMEHIKEQLAELTATERAELAQYLLCSLDDADERDVEAAWLAEAQRRMADAKNGKVTGIPADQVFAKIREKYA